MNSLKILHLSTEKTWRGGEQQIAYLVEELNKTGVKNLLAVQAGSLFENYCNKNGWPVHSLNFSNAFNVNTALQIKSICITENIDLVHLHTSQAHSLGTLAALFGNKTSLILSRRVDFVPKNSFLTKWKYNHDAIKKVICVSHKIETIMRAYLRDPDKSVTVHDGIDVHKFSIPPTRNKLRDEFTVPDNAVIIGNTSALADHKDYYTFIDTIKILVEHKRAPIAFIIGQGPLELKLKAYVNDLKLSAHIHFTGFRNDIAEVLPCFDFFLMTSKEEGLGTSVLDAFATGVAVVSTNAGGLPEMVRHDETGVLANIKDPAALASGIERLIDNAALKRTIVQNAKKTVLKFSKEVMAGKTLEIYNDAVSNN